MVENSITERQTTSNIFLNKRFCRTTGMSARVRQNVPPQGRNSPVRELHHIAPSVVAISLTAAQKVHIRGDVTSNILVPGLLRIY